MTFLSFSWLFGFLAVLHEVLDLNFKFCAFIVNELIKGEIEKPSDQLLYLIVMSHWLSDVWIRIQDILVGSTYYLYIVWRIVFAYLMVCRWQVRHDGQRRGPWQKYETWCRGPGMIAQFGCSVAARSGGWVMLCAACTVHVEMMSVSFLVEPQNQCRRFVSGFASKPLWQFSPF
jgi:hypothetical protein